MNKQIFFILLLSLSIVFLADSTPPLITIESPLNISYNNSNILLNINSLVFIDNFLNKTTVEDNEGIVYGSPLINNSVSFATTGNYITYPNFSFVEDDYYSIEFRFTPNKVEDTVAKGLISGGNHSLDLYPQITIINNKLLYYANGSNFVYSSINLNNSKEYHVVVITNGDAKFTSIYIDGVMRNGTKTITGGYNRWQTLTLGRSLSSLNRYFNGTLNYLNIYHKKLSLIEINNMYEGIDNNIKYNWNGTNYTYSKIVNTSFYEGENTLHTWIEDSSGNINYTNITFTTPLVNYILFKNQTPADLTSTNVIGGVNITYNSSYNNLYLQFKINSTERSCIISFAGTCFDGYYATGSKTGTLFDFYLFDNSILPGNYYVVESYIENTPKTNNHTLNNLQKTVKYNLYNFSGTEYGFIEVMAYRTSGAGPLGVWYCNSSYTSGNINNNPNCDYLTAFTNTTFNHEHSAYSKHLLAILPNLSSGYTPNNILISNNSYIIFKNINTATTWLLPYIANATAGNVIQYSGNSGGSWSNLGGYIDSHVHMFDGDDRLNYRACNTTSFTNCSAWRSDSYELDPLPVLPNIPYFSIVSPVNTTYTNTTILLNLSLSSNVSSVWFNWNGTNVTYTTPILITFPNATITLDVFANSSDNYNYSDEVVFTTDNSTAIIMQINIISPINLNYIKNNITVEITGTNYTTLIYNWNGTNATYIAPIVITFTPGSHTLYAWATRPGSANMTSVSFSVIDTSVQSNKIAVVSPETEHFVHSKDFGVVYRLNNVHPYANCTLYSGIIEIRTLRFLGNDTISFYVDDERNINDGHRKLTLVCRDASGTYQRTSYINKTIMQEGKDLQSVFYLISLLVCFISIIIFKPLGIINNIKQLDAITYGMISISFAVILGMSLSEFNVYYYTQPIFYFSCIFLCLGNVFFSIPDYIYTKLEQYKNNKLFGTEHDTNVKKEKKRRGWFK